MQLKYFRGSVLIGNNVKLSLSTKFEDKIKIYNNSQIIGSSIGRGSYLGWNCIYNNAMIGRFCSIGPFSEVIYGTHPSKMISTHPSFYSTQKQAGFSFVDNQKFKEFNSTNSGYSVDIGNDVWIGYGASIMEGVKIADGSIIGAKSLVTKDTEPYSINVGNPTRKIKSRFEKDQIKNLLNFKWWDHEIEYLEKNKSKFLEEYEIFCTLIDEKK